MKQFVSIIVAVFLFLGCSKDDDGGSSGGYLKLVTVSSSSSVKAGYPLYVEVTVDSGQALEDVPITFAAVKSDDQNSSVDLDDTEITALKEGNNKYKVSITVPRDVVAGQYTIIANIDPDDQLGNWNDDTQFIESTVEVTVAPHGPDAIIVSEPEDDSDVTPSAQRSSSVPGSIVIEANDENISVEANVILQPNLSVLNATDISVSACINVGSQCIPLPLWSSDGNGTLSNTLELKGVEQGYGLLVAVDTVVPKSTVAKIVNEIVSNVLLHGSILNTSLKLTLAFNGQSTEYVIDRNFKLTPELLASLTGLPAPQRSSARQGSGSCKPKVLNYAKEYSRSKYGKYFGTGIFVKGSAGFDSEGMHSKAYGSVRVKAMGKKERFLKLNFKADALPGSFEKTGYDLDVEVLQVTVYSKSKSLSDAMGLSTPALTTSEKQAIKVKADNNASLTESQLRRQKLYNKTKKKVTSYSGSGSTAVSLIKNWDIGKRKGFTQQYIVGIVPVKITAGAQATVGFESSVGLTGITAVQGTFKPLARIGAYVQGGVGVVGYSAGVEANLWLVTESLRNKVTGELVMVESADGEYITQINGDLEERITNYFRGPNGKLYLYAEYSVPKYCRAWGKRYVCGVKTKTKRRYLSKMSTSTSKRTLLDKKQTAFSIPLDDCN